MGNVVRLDGLKRCIIASGSFYAARGCDILYAFVLCVWIGESRVITPSNCDEDVPYRSFSHMWHSAKRTIDCWTLMMMGTMCSGYMMSATSNCPLRNTVNRKSILSYGCHINVRISEQTYVVFSNVCEIAYIATLCEWRLSIRGSLKELSTIMLRLSIE